MNEWIQITTVCGSAFLFSAGGTKITPKLGGQKWLRRELLPVFLAFIALIRGVLWWKCLLFAILTDLVFRLPYGERTPLPLKALVFASYVLPTALFGLTPWQPILASASFILFIASNHPKTAKFFHWAVCCSAIGFIYGACVVSLWAG